MKLNGENFDHETLEVVSSKLSSKMDNSMAIIGGSIEDAFSLKLYYVLKSEYSVYLAISQKNNFKFPSVNFEDLEYLKAFLIYNKISIVLVTSEIIISYIQQENEATRIKAFYNFIAFCRRMSIKVIFIEIENLFCKVKNKYQICGSLSGDRYTIILNKFVKKVLSVKSNLVITFSFVYGLNEIIEELEFSDFLSNRQNLEELSLYNKIIMKPVLNDEAARFVGGNLEQVGKIEPSEIGEKDLEQWFQELNQRQTGTKGQPLIPCEHLIENNRNFCNTEEGHNIILHQKKCAFNLIYKFSPLEKFCDHRVAQVRIDLGKRLDRELNSSIKSDADFVVPVPQTGIYYAMGLAQQSGIPFLQAFIKDSNAMRSFQVLDVNVRKEIIKKKIFPIQELIEGRNLIVVDEAIFTGTTLKIVCKVLRECGAKKIHLAIPTPACYHQCPYYSQPRRTMLLEYVRESTLDKYFDVDSVTFQSLEGFDAELNKLGICCSYCFNKE